MKFGPLPIGESEGVFLAQAIRRPGLTLRKGEWIGAGQIAALQAAHIAEIVAARIRRALPYVPAERIVIAPDCGMKYLPRGIAFQKMKAMVEGTRLVRKERGGGE